MGPAVRILLAVLVLLIPGLGILAVAVALGRRAWKAMKVPRPSMPIPLRSPAGLVVFDWDDWRRVARQNYPVRYFLTEWLPATVKRLWWRLCDAFYEWRSLHWYKDQYLDLRTGGYDWGYMEPGEVVLHAAFSALVEWAENEGEDLMRGDEHGEVFPEVRPLRALYVWWTQERPRRKFEIEFMQPTERAIEEQALYLEEQAMFRLLVDARSAMF